MIDVCFIRILRRVVLVVAGSMPLAAWGSDNQRELHLPSPPYRYGDEMLPAHFRTPAVQNFDTTPADNPMTDAGATLGRVLFYDTRLSANDRVSCASCHEQQRAFSDSRPLSIGFEGKEGDRNAMSLVNLRYGRAGFFWDERAATLEEQALLPIHSRIEMGRNPNEVVTVIQGDERYIPLFHDAFGDGEINEPRIAKALAQFIRALVSGRSKYDVGFQATGNSADKFANFTTAENRGKQLFRQHCMACHTLGSDDQTVLFHMFRSLNNGLDRGTNVADVGQGDVTMIPSDAGHFKASSLRNVEFTAPYMHDGRIATLEGVIEHYSTGVERHPGLGPVRRFQFSETDKAALVAFLKTLSDAEFISDPRFANPWSTTTVDEVQPLQSVTASIGEIDRPSPRLNRAERARLVAERKGLPYGEVIAWLHDLDIDGSGGLDATEYVAVAEIGSMALSGELNRRERRRANDAADGTGSAAIPREGGPDTTDPLFSAFKHLVSYGDGGRGEVFLDRFFERYPVDDDKRSAARALLREVKQRLHQQVALANQQLHVELAIVLDEDDLRYLQQLVLLRGVDRTPPPEHTAADTQHAMSSIAAFDVDEDGYLNSAEMAQLAYALESAPGGFAAPRTTFGNMIEFHKRIMAYDADGDGSVTLLELPERMAAVVRFGDKNQDGRVTSAEAERHLVNTAFEHLSEQGIYIGGGFENVYARVARLLPEMGLDEQRYQKTLQLLKAHNRHITSLAEAAVAESYPRYRALTDN